jgi:hypothetical protein
MIGGNVFWRKKKSLDMKTKQYLIEELKKLRNNALFVKSECDKILKKIEEL